MEKEVQCVRVLLLRQHAHIKKVFRMWVPTPIQGIGSYKIIRDERGGEKGRERRRETETEEGNDAAETQTYFFPNRALRKQDAARRLEHGVEALDNRVLCERDLVEQQHLLEFRENMRASQMVRRIRTKCNGNRDHAPRRCASL